LAAARFRHAAISVAVCMLACVHAFAEPSTPAPVVQELVVTGTHIPEARKKQVTPIVMLGSKAIEAQGLVRIEDAINRLPMAYADQSSTVTNGATGTATVNLRNLGSERTLVLIDGKRLMPGDPTSGEVAPDLNFIPTALVDRIEIVTGGASSVYGSDAIAGAVNFILKHEFKGLQLDAEAGFFNHVNGDAEVQSLIRARGDAMPAHTVNDGLTYDVNVTLGARTPDGRGSLEAYGGYRRIEAVTEASRDFSACPIEADGPTPICSGSPQSTPRGSFYVFNPTTFNFVGVFTLDQNGPGDTLRPRNQFLDVFNFAPYQYFQRPDTRYTAGAFARYAISPALELYASGMFMDDSSTAELAPSGLFATAPAPITCNSPLLSAAETAIFCGAAGVPPGGQPLVYIGRRNVEGGPRQFILTHVDYRVLLGARGNEGPWSYDISVQYGAVSAGQTYLNDVSLSRAADALNVIVGPGGNLVCASGDPGCVPYDIFKIGGVTKAALAYIETPARATGSTGELVASATVTGDFTRFGVRSPWASSGLAVALGAEYRRESLGYSPDAELASGDLASAGVANPPISGSFDVKEAYVEARAPLVQDKGPLLNELSLEAGYRFAHYSLAGNATAWKVGAEWSPTPDVRFRASYDHAVRAPNVAELFNPPSISFGGLVTDPCAGSDPVQANSLATPANCARTGVTASQYGQIAANPGAYNSLEGGNPNLKPEAENTFRVGLVATPRALKSFTASIDYFNIDVANEIDALSADVIIQECLATGDSFYCSLVHRAPVTGSLWISPNGYVSDVLQNTLSLRTSGFDVDADERIRLPALAGRDLGSLDVSLIGTYLIHFTTQVGPGAPSFDCAGYYGFGCGIPLPAWRHTLRATWRTPWTVDATLAWRYLSPLSASLVSTNPALNGQVSAQDAQLGARSYFDLTLAWRFRPGFELRAGVDNILDTDPPVVGLEVTNFPGLLQNSNTYPGLYDALGRFIFAGLTARF
jgi:outer membrane receptor protein involved in Fe transport